MSEAHDFREWQALDAAHLLHPFSDSKQIASRGTRLITRAEVLTGFEQRVAGRAARFPRLR